MSQSDGATAGAEGQLTCYECGELTPVEGGPLCWVCRSKEKSQSPPAVSQATPAGQGAWSRPASAGGSSSTLTTRERSLVQSAQSLGGVANGVAIFLLGLSLLAAVVFVIVAFAVPDLFAVALAMGVLCAFSGVMYWVIFRLLGLVSEYVAVRVSRLGSTND